MQKKFIHFFFLPIVNSVNSVRKSAFFKLLFYMIQNAILTAAFIVLAYLLSLLHERTFGEKWYIMDMEDGIRSKPTFGEKWYDLDDRILRGVFGIVNIIAALQFIVLNVFHGYITLREELRNANSRDNNNGNN